MKILVIAPHPDDEVLGCGGTIKKHSNNGDEVCLCIVTTTYAPDWTESFIENRKKEIEESKKILGIKETYFLNLPTVKLDLLGQKKLSDLIRNCIIKFKPEIFYIPSNTDTNKDHQLIYDASLVACRPSSDFSVRKIISYSYESLFFVPNLYVDISSAIKDKIKAMSCYESEIKNYPHPRSLKAIKIIAQKRGIESGLKLAEAFKILREIN